jgi:hypothetical protein
MSTQPRNISTRSLRSSHHDNTNLHAIKTYYRTRLLGSGDASAQFRCMDEPAILTLTTAQEEEQEMLCNCEILRSTTVRRGEGRRVFFLMDG